MRSVKTDDIIVCELVKLGHQVLAEKESGVFELAVVKSHWKTGERLGYVVQFDDQSTMRYSTVLSVQL